MSRRGGNFVQVSGADIAAKAIKVWVCNGCEKPHRGKKPMQCLNCGRMDFTMIDSGLEAAVVANLKLLELGKEIADLRLQVRYDLVTVDADDNVVKVGEYIADATFTDRRDGKFYIVDVKPRDRQGRYIIDPVSRLKHRWMECMGLPVTIRSS